MDVKILAATLLCDRKAVWPVSLDYLLNEPLIDEVYVNIETQTPERYGHILDTLKASGKPYDVDSWWFQSSWLGRPKYDQDTARFIPIVRGRNMALQWALTQVMMYSTITHLLFVDSDVRPHKGGLEHLLALNKPLCGGFVPGRGAHSHVHYVFGVQDDNGTVVRCAHGTSGYLLLARTLFPYQVFRWGPHPTKGTILCDDPAYAADAVYHNLADGWYIDRRATADHVDDPEHPLTLKEAINDYHV